LERVREIGPAVPVIVEAFYLLFTREMTLGTERWTAVTVEELSCILWVLMGLVPLP